jgi:hypothetical protein
MNRAVIMLACLALSPACHHHKDEIEDGGAEDQGVDAGLYFDLSGDDGATELTSGALVIAPVPLAFHHVPNGTMATLQLGLANTGKKNIVVSSATIVDTAFMFDGGSGSSAFMFTVDTSALPLTLEPGMTAQLPVSFAPAMHGDFTGMLTITSDASTTPAVVELTGSSGYKVVLNWDAPVLTDGGDPAVGYNVYRGAMVGGPYTKINAAIVPVTTYTDSTVQDCTIYEYATTSVDSMGNESVYSNQVEVSIPCP